MLWCFSRAWVVLRKPEFARLAGQTFATLNLAFVDHHYGGVFYAVDEQWQPTDTRKHMPSQAMTLLALAAFASTGLPGAANALEQAKDLFALISGLVVDGAERDRAWRLSADAAPEQAQSRILGLGAFAALAAAWQDPSPKRAAITAANAICQSKPNPKNYALRLEASWQMSAAAGILNDDGFSKQARVYALETCHTLLAEGIGADNVLRDGAGVGEHGWRAQAEGVIGFYNAYQLSGDARFLRASRACWNVIEQFFIDYANGEWFKTLNKHWQASPDGLKIGGAFGPLHHTRMGLEMMKRLEN